MGFVNWAPSLEFSLCFACIHSTTVNTSFEESRTSFKIDHRVENFCFLFDGNYDRFDNFITKDVVENELWQGIPQSDYSSNPYLYIKVVHHVKVEIFSS